MITKTKMAKSSSIGSHVQATPVPLFLKWFLPAMFTGAFISSAIAAIVYKANRALSLCLVALSSMAVGVGVGLHKRRHWAIPATHLLFAHFTLFALAQVAFLGLGAGAPQGQYVNTPTTTWGWIAWSMTNARGVAPTLTPIALSLILAVWVPSCVCFQGERARKYFGLAISGITGRPLIVCVSLGCLLPIYGFAIPVMLFDQRDLLEAGPALQLLCSIDAWVGLATTVYGVRAGIELWRRNSEAVRHAKNLLAFRFIYSVSFAALVFILSPSAAADYLFFGAGHYSFLTGIASAVLYIFLKSSKL